MLAQPTKQSNASVLLVYEGIHADSEADLKTTEAILKTCFRDRQGFYYGHPLLGYFFTELPGQHARKDTELEKRFRALMKQHVIITDAGLFLAPDERLCGWQVLRIGEPDRFVEACNGLISSHLAETVSTGLTEPKRIGKEWDRETVRLVRKAIRGHHHWLRLEPGRLSFTLPGSQPFFAALKRQFLAGLPQDKGEDARRLQTMLSNTPLSIDQRRDRLTLALGVGDGEPMRVDCDYGPHEVQDFDAQLIEYAGNLSGKLEKGRPENFVADFLHRHYPPRVD